MSRALRTLAEIEAAGRAEWHRQRDAGARMPTQAHASLAHALISPHLPRMTAAQAAPHAA